MHQNDLLKALIISDALSAPFDTLSGGHIKTHFREIKGYTDAAPALKGNMQKWKKPGLYTFVSQLSIIAAVMGQNRIFTADSLLEMLRKSSDIENYDFKFLRNPDYLSQIMCTSPDIFRSSHENRKIRSNFMPLFTAVMGSFVPGKSINMKDLFLFCSSLTSDPQVITCSVFTCFLLRKQAAGSIKKAAVESAQDTTAFFGENQPFLFESGFNPDAFIQQSVSLKTLIDLISENPSDGAGIIIENFNRNAPTPVTRATIDDPSVIIAYAVSLVMNTTAHSADQVLSAVQLGGCVHALAVYTAVFCTVASGRDIFTGRPDLLDGLANKRKITEIISLISENKFSMQALNEFIISEIPLTRKAIEELNARIKKIKTKIRKNPVKKTTQEEKLSRHVVESWTKMDKARYRKQKYRNSPEGGDEFEE